MSDTTAIDDRAGGGGTPGEQERRLLAARELAVESGRLLLERFRGELTTSIKERDSAVSDADQAAEVLLRRRIVERFPDDSVLGEEGGLEARDGDWCWTLDPIDGTHNFIAGIPIFSVAIGVLHAGWPAIGIIHDPCRGEIYEAARGYGARLGDTPLAIADAPLDRMSMLAVRHRFMRGPRAVLLDALPTRKHRCLGSICLEMAYTAAGSFRGVIAGSARLWEAVPGTVLIEEAGGVMRDFVGGPLFPLREAPAVYEKYRFRLLGGGASVVEELVAHMQRIPL